MPPDEHLPKELDDCQRMLLSLVPHSSRVDRDRLMIRLGEQNVARRSVPWKWCTFASLLLAVVLGLRPAFTSHLAETAPATANNPAEAPPPATATPPQQLIAPDDASTPQMIALPSSETPQYSSLTEDDWAFSHSPDLRHWFARHSVPTLNQAELTQEKPALKKAVVRPPILRSGDRQLLQELSQQLAPSS